MQTTGFVVWWKTELVYTSVMASYMQCLEAEIDLVNYICFGIGQRSWVVH